MRNLDIDDNDMLVEDVFTVRWFIMMRYDPHATINDGKKVLGRCLRHATVYMTGYDAFIEVTESDLFVEFFLPPIVSKYDLP